MFVLAAVPIALWMAGMVRQFAAGQGWWDWGVRIVVGELVICVLLFSAAILFTPMLPPRIHSLVNKAGDSLRAIVIFIILLVVVTLAATAFILPWFI